MEIMKKYGIAPNKGLGQNFLVDGNIAQAIVKGCRLQEDDNVLEIGPGLGALTAGMAVAAGRVVAVEIDKGFIPVLQDNLQGFDNVEIINMDIMKMDLKDVVRTRFGGRPFKVVGNLPYYLTTPIIMKLLEQQLPITTMVFMIQKEVGQRLSARPSTKEYGALTLAVGYYTDCEVLFKVPNTVFIPRPKVDSIVIRLTPKAQKNLKPKDERLMFRIIRAAFEQRRKTLVNALAHGGILGGDKERIRQVLKGLDIGPESRGEQLTLEQYCKIADNIYGLQKLP
ncbi:MAG TPA: 16S rRNA (adenine(1518)-N(6)/adenine(1519)-N(6))-dimethyltransferase RsmA [Clostridiales bacterium]|nr:16S rRNA (adenine(1518)-N(6)/adenine(1519)-N(6))-dimethyltransferase RsmA [Clostridiales bacterium]